MRQLRTSDFPPSQGWCVSLLIVIVVCYFTDISEQMLQRLYMSSMATNICPQLA